MTNKTLAKWRLKRLTMAFTVLVLMAVAGTIFAYPAVAAFTCPTCYGLGRLDSNTFVD
jgi:hypothetical protein